MGCLPVTVADHILEPFEPAVSWDEWGVRVAEADIPRLHHILQGLGHEEVARRQVRTRQVVRGKERVVADGWQGG